MKTSILSSKSKSFVFLLALAPSLVHAALVGKVQSLKGEAFMVFQGKTSVLQVGSDVEDGSDILVSDEASLTVGDFFDRRHHLSGGTNLTMNDRAVVLKKGALWTQSVGARSTGQITTANMLIQAEQGEWVTTYDSASGRTQLTAISGEVRVASPQEPAFQYAVSAGMFTLADPKADEGYPRSPTKLGYDSLMKTLALFPGQKSRDAGLAKFQEEKAAKTDRKIASVEETPASAPGAVAPKAAKGEITFISTEGAALSYFEKKIAPHKKLTKRKVAQVKTGWDAPVRIIGVTSHSPKVAAKPALAQKSERAPASTRPASAPKAAESLDDKSNDFFESYEQYQKAQPKNPSEMQRLIDDLQSY